MNSPDLDTVGRTFGTDKSSELHDYLRRYEAFLAHMKNEAFTLVESGVLQGASLRTWATFFPQARIIGLDYDRSSWAGDANWPNVSVLFGDCTLPDVWNSIPNDMLVFIDDGAHFSRMVPRTFSYAWPKLASGGYYFVEDLHASYCSYFTPSGQESSMRFFCRLLDSMNHHGKDMTGKRDASISDIDSMCFSKSMLIMRKCSASV